MGNSESTQGELPQKSEEALVSFCKENLTNSVLELLIKPNDVNAIVASKTKKTNTVVRFTIDLKKKRKNMIVKNFSQKISLGPFQIEANMSGDYNMMNRKGYMQCELNLRKPFELKQTITLVNSLLKLKYQASILKLLQSFNLTPVDQLKRYLDILIVFELKLNPIQKNWNIRGALQSNKYKFNIFTKEFGVTQIGFEISGKRKDLEEKKIHLIVKLDTIDLKVVHSFRKEYLFSASIDKIPFGKMISNLAEGFDDPLDVLKVLEGIQLQKNILKFKDFQNINVKSACEIGSCETSIQKGKFSSIFLPKPDFRFKNICSQINFLDELHLQKIIITVSNQSKKRGITIEGLLPVIKKTPLDQLFKILYSSDKKDFQGIPFSLTVINWKQIFAKIAIMKDCELTKAVIIKQLSVTIKPSISSPQFGVQGTIKANICDNQLQFRLACIIGQSCRLQAQMIGTWKEPLGLKNCYIKDLLLSIGYMNCAFAGEIKIGEMTAAVAVAVDIINPLRNMFYFNLEKFQLAKILSVFSVQLPDEIAKILNAINIEQMAVSMVPIGGMMLGSKFYEEGFSASIKCQIFGFKAKFQLGYKKNSLKIFGEIDPITIPNIFTLRSSTDKNKGPCLDVKLAYSASAHFKIDGFISIFNLLEQEVFAKADAQGLTFYTRRAIKLFGMNFVESSFLFRAGLLKISDGFLIQALFKTDENTLKVIQQRLTGFAQQASQPFHHANKELRKIQQNFNQIKKKFDIENQKQKNKVKNAQRQYQAAMNRHRKQAKDIFDRQRQRVDNQLNNEKQRAKRTLDKAKRDATDNLNREQQRAKNQLNRQKNRAERELQQRRKELKNTMKGERDKLNGLNDSIRWHEEQPWYSPARAGLIGLYPAKGIAQGALYAAEKAAELGINAGQQIYRGILKTSQGIYWGILKTSQATCHASITIAEASYNATLQTAKFTYNQSMKNIQYTYDQALAAATEVGRAASHAYIAAVDTAFNIAKSSLDAASATLEIAKKGVDAARLTCKFALDLLAEIVKGISAILVIRTLFFELDVKKKRVVVAVDILAMGKQLKCNIEASFDDIVNFLSLLATRIWKFISGQK